MTATGKRLDESALMLLHERGPRYTSYPTAADFSDDISIGVYKEALQQLGDDPISLYVHLPFCKSLCTYCGCLMLVRKSADDAWRYLKALAKELRLIGKEIGHKPLVRHLHFGGGTPNFLSTDQFYWLMREIQAVVTLDDETVLCPGHGPLTTVGEEKAHNPFF